MKTHTEGDWRVVMVGPALRYHIICDNIRIAATFGDDPNDKANAQLMAAAPELISALEFAAKYHLLQKQKGKDGFPVQLETAINLAISKAKGGAS